MRCIETGKGTKTRRKHCGLIETWDVLKRSPLIPPAPAIPRLIETWDVLKRSFSDLADRNTLD